MQNVLSFFQNEINILLFKGNVTHRVLHQNEIYSSIQDVIFGVAILDKNKVSSGIRWQDPCRYKKDYGIIKYCIVKIYNFDTCVIAMILTQINWRSCVFLWRCKMYFRLSLITFSSLRISFTFTNPVKGTRFNVCTETFTFTNYPVIIDLLWNLVLECLERFFFKIIQSQEKSGMCLYNLNHQKTVWSSHGVHISVTPAQIVMLTSISIKSSTASWYLVTVKVNF